MLDIFRFLIMKVDFIGFFRNVMILNSLFYYFIKYFYIIKLCFDFWFENMFIIFMKSKYEFVF